MRKVSHCGEIASRFLTFIRDIGQDLKETVSYFLASYFPSRYFVVVDKRTKKKIENVS